MSDSIQHIIVLMLENRSFDHFLGALPNVDGIDPQNPRFNLESPRSSTKYEQQSGAVRKMKPDPPHETKNVLRQIDAGPLGEMGGFVYDFAVEKPGKPEAYQQAMSYFDVGTLPAIHELAQNFCVIDSWFSSVPGPTWTNRFFVHSGTSQGWVEMPHFPDLNLHKYDQTTIYDRLNESKISWGIYAGDIPQSLLLYNQRKKENRRYYHRLSQFYSDVADDASAFPTYVFIEPAYLPFGQNDQHPPHDVLKGDDLVATVYNALRANEELWASTLLIVTWDEHGGFYDHIYPPQATPPDAKNQEGFDFTRFGVRVPTILISPWVAAGSVFRPEEGVLDHTSILKYLTRKFSLGPLLKRVANAADFEAALIDEANKGAPEKVGLESPPMEMTSVGEDEPDELNRNQRGLIEFSKQLELEMAASPEAVGTRALRARTSTQAEIEVAKERTWLFIEQ